MTLKTSNPWTIWRPIYRFTWAQWQLQSYRHFAQKINGLSTAVVLDIGTGTGEYIQFLNFDPRKKFIFSDPDYKSLQIAQRRAETKGLNAEFIVGDAFAVMDRVDNCTILSLVHVLSVLDRPFEFVDRALKKYGDEIEILAYLSKFNEVSRGQKTDFGLGFARLSATDLRSRFDVCKISRLVNLYYR